MLVINMKYQSLRMNCYKNRIVSCNNVILAFKEIIQVFLCKDLVAVDKFISQGGSSQKLRNSASRILKDSVI